MPAEDAILEKHGAGALCHIVSIHGELCSLARDVKVMLHFELVLMLIDRIHHGLIDLANGAPSCPRFKIIGALLSYQVQTILSPSR